MLRDQQAAVFAVAFSLDGTKVVNSYEHGVITVWDLTTGKVLKAIQPHLSTVFDIAFSPDGKLVFTGGHGKRIKIWDAEVFLN